MSPWAKKRKLIVYGIILAVIISSAISYLLGKLLKEPTCFDNKQNGEETGIDCGGICQLACSNEFKDVKTSWAKSIEISGDIYNIAAMLENTNKSYEIKTDYRIDVYSDFGNLLWTSNKTVDLAPLEKRIIFEPHVYLDKNNIKNTFINVTNSKATKNYKKQDMLSRKISSLNFEIVNNIPTLSAIVSNNTVSASGKLEAVGILYDENMNIINFSKTTIDSIASREKKKIYFTWQKKFKKEVTTYKIFIRKI